VDAHRRQALVDLIAQRSTAELESFFQSHGLGDAFARPKEGWGRRKRVNEALLQAERRGNVDVVLADAQRRFEGATPAGEPVKPLARIRLELQELADDMDAWDSWKYADVAEQWKDRLNGSLSHLRIHVGADTVSDDFAFGPRDYSSTGKTMDEGAFRRLRQAVGRSLEIVSSAAPSQAADPPDARLAALHPEIRRVSERLFRDGHPGASIFEAFKAVNNRVKHLTGLTADGKGLMATAFDEQRPLLRINEGRTQSDRDEQEGFKFIYMGAMLGIRNPKAHEELPPTEEERALEYLAVASLLMRRLDDAEMQAGRSP
jgi:uncharacterized protein (TIGR02391 family)